MSFELTLSTELSAPAEQVWAQVSTLEGVNLELRPWVRMSVPRAAHGRQLDEVPAGEVALTSTLWALGIVPFDRHRLQLVEAERGRFLERSSSLLQRVWEHERWVEATPTGCRVRDRLRVEPRGAPGALVRVVVGALFRWRHRQLRRMFDAAGPSLERPRSSQ
ncbi:MAG: SRPBCC family protein [Myxococcales bacterium]|nr:SRPBCC family protein [Myxococcales bacterium]